MSRHSKRNGRSKGDRFVMLPHVVLRSAGYRSLSPPARCVLIELLAIYDGKNNGRLAFSARQGAEALNVVKDTAARALIELRETGFLEVVKGGSFSLKGKRPATEYRLTLHRCDVTGKTAANSFMKPSENAFEGFSGPIKSRSGPVNRTRGAETHPESASLVPVIGPERAKKAFPGPINGTHIVYHIGERSGPQIICDDPTLDGPTSCALHGWRGRA